MNNAAVANVRVTYARQSTQSMANEFINVPVTPLGYENREQLSRAISEGLYSKLSEMLCDGWTVASIAVKITKLEN